MPHQDALDKVEAPDTRPNMVLFEVPANFQTLKTTELELAKTWRMYSRTVFELLFSWDFLITDFLYLPGDHPQTYYLFSQKAALDKVSG